MSGGMTIERIAWHPLEAELLADHLTSAATERAGHLLLDAAQRRVPYATGNLAASAEIVQGEAGDVAVGWGADYARYLHAHPEWQYQGGRSGRWVEEAEAEAGAEIGAVIAETFRAGWPG